MAVCHLQADNPDSVGAEMPAPISISDNRLKSTSSGLPAVPRPPGTMRPWCSKDDSRFSLCLGWEQRGGDLPTQLKWKQRMEGRKYRRGNIFEGRKGG